VSHGEHCTPREGGKILFFLPYQGRGCGAKKMVPVLLSTSSDPPPMETSSCPLPFEPNTSQSEGMGSRGAENHLYMMSTEAVVLYHP
jgi:hypothetical protein